MFQLSGKSLTYLSNTLFALPGWRSLLERFGLADPAEYVEMMTLGDPEVQADYDSWKNLKSHLDYSNKAESEQLRSLCSDLLRKKEVYRTKAKDQPDFLNAVAQFEVQLSEDGFVFDGFEVLASKQIPPVAQLADESLKKVLQPPAFPLAERVEEHRAKAAQYLAEERYVDCMTNLRLALKYTLEGSAKKLAMQRNEALPSEKEHEVRKYLRRIGFLSEEECRGFSGIYGLLSAGPHGNPDKSLALLGYAACMLGCQYAFEKLRNIGTTRTMKG